MVPMVVLVVALVLGRTPHREGRRGCVIGVDCGVRVGPAPRRDHGDGLHVGRCRVKEFGAACDGARALGTGRRYQPAGRRRDERHAGREGASVTSTMP